MSTYISTSQKNIFLPKQSGTLNKISDLEVYYNEIRNCIKHDKNLLFLNHDRAHNAIVMRNIFENSNEVKMFCGEMSIFRKKFAENVRENISGDYNKFQVMEDLYTSLKLFLEKKGSRLDIIIEDYDINSFWNDICINDILDTYLGHNLFLYQMNYDEIRKGDKFHFTIGDSRMYRVEIDKEPHQAICDFKNESTSSMLNEQFRLLLEETKEIKRYKASDN